MTFDEARRYLIANFEDMNLEAVISVLSSVREEYASTVEMTQEQVDELNYTKNNLRANDLPRVIHNGDGGDWSYLDEFSGRLFKHQQGGMTDKNIEDIMQIWLHPEIIKVVDE
ncbi:hypothetical protein [Leuconostoc suionicum]|uniref:hypothetical protein n=1 Tax=Leuconostoc suionicum TaxID=1511761 RepID=UPI0009093F05|nr:hypothetical protein [Leuconostoc suionicum]API72619.1 hypothetical protein A6B45_07980 [Leuconostoc suionicum]BAX71288.1 hypothetical protein LEUCM_01850 [Leuconostoc suionicum]